MIVYCVYRLSGVCERLRAVIMIVYWVYRLSGVCERF